MPVIPSLDEQLRRIRESADNGVAIVHVDTCLPEYLGDHHNRDGECLFGVYLDGATSAHEVLQGLLDEMRQTGDRVPEIVTDDEMKACAKAWFADAFGTSPEALAAPFDSSLDIISPEDHADFGESCQAWFVLTWEVPSE